MATRQQLIDALMKADEAGDEEAAGLFADQIKAMDANRPNTDTLDTAIQSTQAASSGPIGSEGRPPLNDRERRSAIKSQEYNNAPWYQKAPQAADDMMRIAADGISFGYADKLMGGENRDLTEDARARAGSAAVPAEMFGAGMSGAGAARMGLSASRYIPEGASLISRLLAATGAGAIDGTAMGALNAAGHDEDVGRGAAVGGITGGALGPLAELGSTLVGKGLTWAKGLNKTPTLEEVKRASKEGYRVMDESGATFSPQAADDMATGIRDVTTNARPDRAMKGIHDPTLAKVKQINDLRKTGDVTLHDLDETRKNISADLVQPGREDKRFGRRMIESIDNFLDNLSPGDMSTKPGYSADDALDGLRAGRSNHRTAAKVGDLEEAIKKADRAVDRSASASTAGQHIRSKISQILEKDALTRGYSADEIARLEGVVSGSKAANRWRDISSLTKSGGARIGAATLGANVGGFMGGPLAMAGGAAGGLAMNTVAGKVAARQAEKATRSQVEEIMGDILRGKPKVNPRAQGMSMKKQAEFIDTLTNLLLQTKSNDETD